jgi:hypothetical protein
MRNAHCGTWNMARILKNVENVTQTLYDLEYGKKNRKKWKMRHRNSRPLNMEKNTEKYKN